MKLANPLIPFNQNELICRDRDDAIRYRIVRRTTLASDTLRITVQVNMLVSTAIQDTARVRNDILAALQMFIKGAPWNLGVIERNTGSVVGYEQVVTTAFATIPSRENFNLPGRAHQASRQGLVLRDPVVDYRLPSQMVEQAVHELRLQTLKQVNLDIQDYEMATGRAWRIGEIRFGNRGDWGSTTTAKGAQRSSGFYEHDDHDDDEYPETGGAECITLITDVCLCSDQAPTC